MELPFRGSKITPQRQLARWSVSKVPVRRLTFAWLGLALGAFLSLRYHLEPNTRLDLLLPTVAGLAAIFPLVNMKTQRVILALASIVFSLVVWGPYVAFAVWAILWIVSRGLPNLSSPALPFFWLGGMALLLYGRKEEWIDGYAGLLLGGLFIWKIPMVWKFDRFAPRQGRRASNFSLLLPLPAITLPLFGALHAGSSLPPRTTARLSRIGSRRVLEGVLLLLTYRIVYSVLHVPASQVAGPFELGLHLLTNAALLIRLAGFVRLSIGLLNVLGYAYALPSVRAALRAGSLLGFMNLLYSPFVRWLNRIIFRPLHRLVQTKWPEALPGTAALPWAGTAMAALLIHSLFWYLRFGHIQLRWLDLIFWAVLILLLAVEKALVQHYRKARMLSSMINVLPRGLVLLIAFPLFSLITTHSLEKWQRILDSGIDQASDIILAFGSPLITIIFIQLIVKYLTDKQAKQLANLAMVAGCLWFVVLDFPLIGRWAMRTEPRSIYLSKPGPSRSDQTAMAGGYYSEIVNPRPQSASDPVESIEIKEKFVYTDGADKVSDFRRITQKRNYSFIFKGHPYTTNSMGFRDKEYPSVPYPNTIRTLLLGSSFVAGSGVRDEEVFDVLLEESMNAKNRGVRYEFLNASCSIYDLIDCIVRFDSDSLMKLQPDYLVYFSHGLDTPKNIRDVVEAKLAGRSMPYPYIDTILSAAGVQKTKSESEAIQAMRPYGTRLVRESYRLLAEKCHSNGIRPVWVYWPCMIMLDGYEQDYRKSEEIATELGFIAIDLEEVYRDFDPSDLIVAPNDHHPNSLGHLLVARALEKHFNRVLNPPVNQ